MKKLNTVFLVVFCLMAYILPTDAQDSKLTHIASYETNQEGNAEVVAYDAATKIAYYTSSENNNFSIVDISTPSSPTLVKSIDLSPYGAGPNSISTNGTIVAVAVESEVKQDSGSVVLFEMDGTHMSTIMSGALPDMLTFTHDGKKILVANEGEPSKDYTNDPVGSVTIIGLDSSYVKIVDFTAYNDKRVSLQNKGIRIFGNDGKSSVAQDLEPEYIAVSADDKLAYVNLQENNAVAVLDLESDEIVDILPLGYKDHSKGTPSTKLYNVNELVSEWPALGTPAYESDLPTVMLGGFSGMWYAEKESSDDKSVFYVIPDRGPNASPVKKATVTPAVNQNLRPFKLPDYQARIVKFTLDNTTGAVTLDDQIMLNRKDGSTPISGRGNIPGFDEVPVVPVYKDAVDVTVLSENFEQDTTLGVFTAYSVSSDKDWYRGKFKDNHFAKANGYKGDGPSEDYLISPALDLSNATSAILTFNTATNFTGGSFKIWVSTDYDGTSNPNDATWADLTDKATLSTEKYEIVESGDIDLSDYLSATTYIAFRYTSTSGESGDGAIWQVDDIKVVAKQNNYATADYTDDKGNEYAALPYDEMGGDFEGILIDKDGNFWMCDEYRPAIYKFDSDGKMIDRYVPKGTSELGATAQPEGIYGNETLPAVYAKRRANRGFEAIAYDEAKNVIYAFIQSPMYNPNSGTKNKSDVIRILGIDANDGTPVEEYVYYLERNRDAGYAAKRTDKMGDAVYTGNGKFLVIERDSEGPDNRAGKKYVFEVNLTGATNLMTQTIADTVYLETMTADEISAMGIQAVHKTKVLNLPSVGYASSDKAEGISLLPNGDIAVMNDNDFGLAGAGITDNSVLGIISFGTDNGFDASNKDDKINITNHPTLGMYMPDAIATYTVDGNTYLVTANEGDARDYDGYSEETRVAKLTLDSIAYPNAATLQENSNLGRLKTTTATGDYDGDGDIDQIYSYGARSFSIFDQYGNLVFDSGNIFGTVTSENEPDLFNEDDGEVDGRSDDKGVEPEAVAIGTIGANTYAFIGLERQSAILVFDITDPYAPKFITYYNNREWTDGSVSGDVSPEIIKFISASDSPNGKEMLLVGYEVSGSMAMIQVGDLTSVSKEVYDARFTLYPNPVSTGSIYFDTEVSGSVYSLEGKLVRTMKKSTSLDINTLDSGIYILNTDKGTQRFVKL